MELPPKHFGRDVEKKLLGELRAKVEGKCSGRFGYTILVLKLDEFGAARLDEDSGWAKFPVRFTSLVFRPFMNQVLPAEVVALNETGVFAEAGPLTIFISQHLMPPDMSYDTTSGQPSFIGQEQAVRINKGSFLIVKIVGIRKSASEIVSIYPSSNELECTWVD